MPVLRALRREGWHVACEVHDGSGGKGERREKYSEFWAENEQIGCACRVPDSAGRATRRFATADSLLRHPTVITALGLPH